MAFCVFYLNCTLQRHFITVSPALLRLCCKKTALSKFGFPKALSGTVFLLLLFFLFHSLSIQEEAVFLWSEASGDVGIATEALKNLSSIFPQVL